MTAQSSPVQAQSRKATLERPFYSALCGVVFDNKQTIGRIALESAIDDAWDSLTAQGYGDDLRTEYLAFLDKEGFRDDKR